MAETPIPEKMWYHLSDLLTRQDELQVIMIEVLRLNAKYLEVIAGSIGDGDPTIPIEIRPITDRLDEIKKKLDRDFPNFLDIVDINTLTVTAYKELNIFGTGFVIKSIGGGFNFKLNNNSGAEIAAVAGDKYDVEFTNILVEGAGVAGTAQIIYWRR